MSGELSDMDRLARLPVSIEGVKAFLSSPYVEGIGHAYASRIVDALGADALDRIEACPGCLADVPGLGSARAEGVLRSLAELRQPVRLLAFLYSCGLSDTLVDKIVSHYGPLAADVILYDPYEMVEDVWKLSFFTADKVGRMTGVADDDPRRLRGALLTAVKMYAEDGSMFATEEQAVALAGRITGVGPDRFYSEIESLVGDERLVRSHGGLYLPVYYKAEKEGAAKLASLVRSSCRPSGAAAIPDRDRDGHIYSPEQRRAVMTALAHPVMVLTGGPGTGKTTVVRAVIDMFEHEGLRVVAAAPTGRAAKRMAELTGREAKTIHRLLGYRPGEGYKNKSLDADVLIIDEGSMMEQVLFNHLLQGLRAGTRVIIVGDPDQLPAIGAGDVLRDLINSGTVPVVSLTENFRQDSGSMIAANARAINAGLLPQGAPGTDFTIIREESVRKIHDRILSLVADEIPSRHGIAARDIQVVSPQQEGPLGARQLNADLQERVNPVGPEVRKGSKVFRLGDRVMQTSNSYDRNIYNGETGVITAVDACAGSVEVAFTDGRVSTYSYVELGELSLAYAITVHKLQGSEVPYMVMPVTMSHKPMLYRNLLYTGVSRARSLCVLVGEDRAVRTAVDNRMPSVRNSNFKHRLQQSLPRLV